MVSALFRQSKQEPSQKITEHHGAWLLSCYILATQERSDFSGVIHFNFVEDHSTRTQEGKQNGTTHCNGHSMGIIFRSLRRTGGCHDRHAKGGGQGASDRSDQPGPSQPQSSRAVSQLPIIKYPASRTHSLGSGRGVFFCPNFKTGVIHDNGNRE